MEKWRQKEEKGEIPISKKEKGKGGKGRNPESEGRGPSKRIIIQGKKMGG